MLEQLVESKSNRKENTARGGFLLTAFVLTIGLCFSAVLWSLLAMTPNVGNDEFDMSSLVAPIIPVEDKPQPPEEPAPKQKSENQEAVNETTRETNTLRMNENPLVPDKISVVPNTQKERPVGAFKIIKGAEVDSGVSRENFNRESNGGNNGQGIAVNNQPKATENNEKDDSPDLKKPVEKEKKPPVVVSKGVINGQATSLPKPIYTAAAKLVKAAGDVSVQVTIDETGRVISAKAVSGHTLLRVESEKAARNARFSPTKLGDQPVKVTGIIIYRFVQ